jgi:hypothetical protein
MTVSSTSNRVVYQGNGTTTAFPFAFKVQQAADLVVVYTDATGTDFTLSGSQYSASGFGLDAGGSVTYPVSGSPIASGTTLTIYRDVAPTQPTSISNQGAMWPQVIEGALDRLTFIVQKIADIASRSLTVSPTDSGSLNPLPNTTQRANSYLAFDGNGQPVAAQNLSLASVSAWLANNFLTQATAGAALGALGGLATSVLTTTGDIFVRGASSIGRLAIGSSGQVLTVVGGTAAWAAASGAYGRTTVADAAYTVVGTDYTVAYTSLTASRAITLPAASTFPAGKKLTIVDEAGAATQTLQLSLAPNGSDTIAGGNTTQVCINRKYGQCVLYSNGTNGWIVEKWSVVYRGILTTDNSIPSSGFANGPQVAQGSVGVWRINGSISTYPPSQAAMAGQLWDGTNTYAAVAFRNEGTNFTNYCTLGPVDATAPAGNLRFDASSTVGGNYSAGGSTGLSSFIRAERIA